MTESERRIGKVIWVLGVIIVIVAVYIQWGLVIGLICTGLYLMVASALFFLTSELDTDA